MDLLSLLTDSVLDHIRSSLAAQPRARADLPTFAKIVSRALDHPVDATKDVNDPVLLTIVSLFDRADRDGLGFVTWQDVTNALLPAAAATSPSGPVAAASNSSSSQMERKGHTFVPRPGFDVRTPFAGRVVTRARVLPALGAAVLLFQNSDEVGLLRLITACETDVSRVHTLGCINVSATTGPVVATPPASHARKGAYPLDVAYMSSSHVLIVSVDTFTIQFWDVVHLAHRIVNEASVASGGVSTMSLPVDTDDTVAAHTSAYCLNGRYARFMSALHVPVPHHHLLWIPDACRLLGASAYGDVQVWHMFAARKDDWQLPEMRTLHRGALRLGAAPIVDMVLMAELGLVATAAVDGSIALWGVQGLPDGYGGRRGAHEDSMNAESFRIRNRAAGGLFYMRSLTSVHTGGLRSLAYVASVRKLVSLGEESWAQVYDLTIGNGTLCYRLQGHTSSLAAMVVVEPSESDAVGEVREIADSETGERLARLRYVHHAHMVTMDCAGELRWWSLSRSSAVLDTERCLQVEEPHPLRSWRAADAVRILINLRQLTHSWLYEQERARIMEMMEHEASQVEASAAADGASLHHDAVVAPIHSDSAPRPRVQRITYDEACILTALGPRWLVYEAVSVHALQLPVTALLYHASSQRIIAVSDRSLRWYDAASGHLTAIANNVLPAACCPRAAAVGASGKRLLMGLAGGSLIVLDPFSGALLRTLHGHTADVVGICYDNSANVAITAAFDGEVHIIDDADAAALERTTEGLLMTPSQRRQRSLLRVIQHAHGFGVGVCALAYNRQQASIATAAVDGSVRLWDFLSLRLTAVCIGHDSSITALAWPDNFPVCISADRSGVINVWHCPRVGAATCRATFALYKGDVSLVESGVWTDKPAGTVRSVRRTSLCVAGTLQVASRSLNETGGDTRQPSTEPSMGGHIVELLVSNTHNEQVVLCVADRLGQMLWFDLGPVLQRLTPSTVHECLASVARRELTPPPVMPWLSDARGWMAERIATLSSSPEELPINMIGYNAHLRIVEDARDVSPQPMSSPLAMLDVSDALMSRSHVATDMSPVSALASARRHRLLPLPLSRTAPSVVSSATFFRRRSVVSTAATEASIVYPTIQSWVLALLIQPLQRMRVHGLFTVSDTGGVAHASGTEDPGSMSPRRSPSVVVSDVSERQDATWQPMRVLTTTSFHGTHGAVVIISAGDDGALNAIVGRHNSECSSLEWDVVGHIGATGGKPVDRVGASPALDAHVRITQRDGWNHVCGKRDVWRLSCLAMANSHAAALRSLSQQLSMSHARYAHEQLRESLLTALPTSRSTRTSDADELESVRRSRADDLLNSARTRWSARQADQEGQHHVFNDSVDIVDTAMVDVTPSDALAHSHSHLPVLQSSQGTLRSPASTSINNNGALAQEGRALTAASTWKLPGVPLDSIMARVDEATMEKLQARARANVMKGLALIRAPDVDRGMSTRAMLRARNPSLMKRLAQLRQQGSSSTACMSMGDAEIRAIAAGERSRDRSHIEEAIEDDRRRQRLDRALAIGVLAELSRMVAVANSELNAVPAPPATAPTDDPPATAPTDDDDAETSKPALKATTMIGVIRAAAKWTKVTLKNRMIAPVVDLAAQAPPEVSAAAPSRPGNSVRRGHTSAPATMPSQVAAAKARTWLHTVIPLPPDEWLLLSRKALIGGQLQADVRSFTSMIKVLRAHETGVVALDDFLRFVERARSRLNSMRKHLEVMFRGADDRGKGVLPLPDFTRVIFPKASTEQVETIIRYALYNGPTADEIQLDYLKRCKPETVELLQQLFEVYDKDGSGSIDRGEMVSALRAMKGFSSDAGGVATDTIAEEVDAMMRAIDTSGDGEISFDEFLAMLGPHFAEM